MLSEIFEVIPCICRLERELFPALYDADGVLKPLRKTRYLRDDEFFASYAQRLKPKTIGIEQSAILLLI